MPVTITITIGSAVNGDPHGGSVFANRGDTITWTGNSEFRLDFEEIKNNGKGHLGWPFNPPEPKWPTRSCAAKLTAGNGVAYYKYTITDPKSGNSLDPIIIIQK